MKLVIDWIWNGPWWTPLIGAIYAGILLSIMLGPVAGIFARKKG